MKMGAGNMFVCVCVGVGVSNWVKVGFRLFFNTLLYLPINKLTVVAKLLTL